MAQERGLDLVEVAPMAQPPVTRFLDFGQYKYELTKREKEAKKRQRVGFKEVRLTPKIGIGDFETKLHRAIEFLEEGDRIKVTVRFRGRELTHPEIGRNLLTRFTEQIKDHGVVERAPLLEGKQMHLTVASTHKPKGQDGGQPKADQPRSTTTEQPRTEQPKTEQPKAAIQAPPAAAAATDAPATTTKAPGATTPTTEAPPAPAATTDAPAAAATTDTPAAGAAARQSPATVAATNGPAPADPAKPGSKKADAVPRAAAAQPKKTDAASAPPTSARNPEPAPATTGE